MPVEFRSIFRGQLRRAGSAVAAKFCENPGGHAFHRSLSSNTIHDQL
jgi:hypothetical protein